jgi:cyclic pyranopterin phosphate synthase
MVDVGRKEDSIRVARATGRITLKPETIQRIRDNSIDKGDLVSCAQIAGILSAKKTHEIIPLCHPISITNAEVNIEIDGNDVVVISEISALAKTGVEMEALTAVAAALLTIWDMAKKYEKDEKGQYPSTRIKEIHVLSKTKEAKEKNELS